MAASTNKSAIAAIVLIAAILLAPKKENILLFITPLFIAAYQLCADVKRERKIYPYSLRSVHPVRNKWILFWAVYLLWQLSSYPWT